jgi:hypothetical protein
MASLLCIFDVYSSLLAKRSGPNAESPPRFPEIRLAAAGVDGNAALPAAGGLAEGEN